MNIKIAKVDLENALQVVSTTLSSQDDISSHYLFREQDGCVEILTYNGTVFSLSPIAGCSLPASETPNESFTIEGKRLRKWLTAVNDGEVVSLDFDPETRLVLASESRGKQRFQSLDPASFPFWDKTLEMATSTATIPASRLCDALNHVRRFISQETKTPQLCVTEFRDGKLYATDRAAVAAVAVPGMENSGARFHGKNVGALVNFLTQFGDGDIEVLEHARMVFFRHAGGAMIGETQFTAVFPTMDVGWGVEDPYTWTLNRGEVEEAISWLQSGAAWDDNKVYMNLSEDRGHVMMSMKSTSGELVNFSVPCLDATRVEDSPTLPDVGIPVPHSYITKALSGHSDDVFVARIGPSPKGKGGLFRIFDDRNNNKYMTIIAWLV